MIKLSDIKLGDKLEYKDNTVAGKWWPCTVQRITHYLLNGRSTTSVTVGWDSPRCRSSTIEGEVVSQYLRKPEPVVYDSLILPVAEAVALAEGRLGMIKELETRLETLRQHNDVLRKKHGDAVDERNASANAKSAEIVRVQNEAHRLRLERDDYHARLREATTQLSAHEAQLSCFRSIEEEWHERDAGQKDKIARLEKERDIACDTYFKAQKRVDELTRVIEVVREQVKVQS